MQVRDQTSMFLLLLLLISLAVAACDGGGREAENGLSNAAPIADAGANQEVRTGTLATLDGNGSHDPDGDALTYSWRITTRPAGSQAGLSAATTVTPSFIPDVDGVYIVTLVVSDGTAQSVPDTVTLISSTVVNSPPVIASFAVAPNPGSVGEAVVFSWDVRDANDDVVTCILDVRGDGSVTVTIDACTRTPSYAYVYADSGVYLPRLTATDGVGAPVKADTAVTIIGPINLHIISPLADQFVDETLRVVVTLQSTFEISDVRARIEDREVRLVFASDAYCDKFGCHPGFAGDLSLTGLARGAKLIEITAQDIQGSIGLGFRRVTFDRKPLLHVAAPLSESVARPEIAVQADCVDDGPAGCEITVSVAGDALASAADRLDQRVDLAAFNGMRVDLEFQARDAVGQSVRATRPVYVEASARLFEVASVSGPVVAVQPGRLLYVVVGMEGDRLEIYDWLAGTITEVEVPAGKEVDRDLCFFTPTGVIYLTKDMGGNVLSSRIYDWRFEVLEDLGFPDSARSLRAQGDFAIWNVGQQLFLRQFSIGTTTQISDTAGNWQNDVAGNSVVGFWSTDYQIVAYRDGVATRLTADGFRNIYVLTDGTAFVYRKQAAQESAVALHDGSQEFILTAYRSQEPSRGPDYQITQNWVAYTELGNTGQLHVWVRDPTGERRQLTFFGSSSTIDTLAANGEVMVIHNRTRYMARDGHLAVVGTDLGRSVWLDGTWYVTIGRSLFQVE